MTGRGKLLETCDRDGVRESFLAPRDHRVGVLLGGAVPPGLSCAWSFDDGGGAPRESIFPCEEEIKLRIPYGHTTIASVDVILPDGTAQRLIADLAVRDVLIAGLGDSIAAGEGNPDRSVRLADSGFCFRRFLGGSRSEYYRPGRDAFTGNNSCEGDVDTSAQAWALQSARWESGPCHRSLYSYQMRTALALAIESRHLAVTFLPLSCSGATIDAGMLIGQRIREWPSPGTSAGWPGTEPGQVATRTGALASARQTQPDRKLDLVLLTIGANDILFSGLVANIIVESTTDRVLYGRGGGIASVEDSQKILNNSLPGNFIKLRAALKPLVGGDLSHIVFVSYGHPALAAPDTPCPGGRDGFDVHPAFAINSTRMRPIAEFVSNEFLPKIKALALCGGTLCREPATDRMTFVDAHQPAFAAHGVCARADRDPEFDRACFSPKGDSFRSDLTIAANDPMTCGRPASEYRPYAPRARWIRTANDSYFTAMTYPQGLPALLQPSNIHDATWGTLSAVYGGAIHPTAEGHAAMADAALPAAREVLNVGPGEATVGREPLPPPSNMSSPLPVR